MTAHMRQAHKPFACKTCPLRFAWESKLTKHQRKCKGEWRTAWVFTRRFLYNSCCLVECVIPTIAKHSTPLSNQPYMTNWYNMECVHNILMDHVLGKEVLFVDILLAVIKSSRSPLWDEYTICNSCYIGVIQWTDTGMRVICNSLQSQAKTELSKGSTSHRLWLLDCFWLAAA